MKASEVRQKYLDFFTDKVRKHKVIEPSKIVLENDPTTLFTSSGMQPLVPYLMGEKHPAGERLVDSQPCIRTQDIDEVGDNRHTTFFEMLGNWSLGDYFKKEQLEWVYEFLTDENVGLGLDINKLYATVFEGNDVVAKDKESIEILKNIFSKSDVVADLAKPEDGLKVNNRIFEYPVKKNWWSRSGTPDEMPSGEPGGITSEIFFDFGAEHKFHENSEWRSEECHPNCDCGRFVEIGNSVFMQYKKEDDGSLSELPNKNVDFGGGFERLVAATIDDPDIFNIDLFVPIIKSLEDFVGKKYGEDGKTDFSYRVIADHLRAAMYLISEGVSPSNKQQGYIVRRLVRRAVFRLKLLGFEIESGAISTFGKSLKDHYSIIEKNWSKTKDTINIEAVKFYKALNRGLRKLEKALENGEVVDGSFAFDLYQTEGFPLELTLEILEQRGKTFSDAEKKSFEEEFDSHREKSRSAAKGMFKGGLADSSEETTRLHSATHLLHWALRQVLGDDVIQKGSNITAERLRFDFNYDQKLTDEQVKEVEKLINEKVDAELPVQFEVMDKEKAEETGAIHAFGEKYGDKVKVYYMGKDLDSAFSKEFCGGPHIANTSKIGKVKLTKQKKIGAGLIRVYAEIDKN